MADVIRARDLLHSEFETVSADATLADVLAGLVAVQERSEIPNALVVLDAAGAYEGLLTSRLLARSLFALWMPVPAVKESEVRLHRELLDVVLERLHVPVRDALVRGIPVVSPDARLLEMIEAGAGAQLEFLPVVENGAALGLVPVTAVFTATASLVLTPGDEGIRFE